MKDINLYWFKKVKNFGDLLSRDLFSTYSFNVNHSHQNNSDAISIGSILGLVDSSYNGLIIGSGMASPLNKSFPSAKILGLRGKLSKQSLSISNQIVLGDPGLLAYRLANLNIQKKYIMGIIPHYIHQENDEVKNLIHRYPNDILFIDVKQEPSVVINEIISCENILSSSLHGLVVSDSLNIPNRWIEFDVLLRGGRFKFKDYYSVVEKNISPAKISGLENLTELIQLTNKTDIRFEEVKHELDAMFSTLSNIY